MDQEQMTAEERLARIAEVKAELLELHQQMPMCTGTDVTDLEFKITVLEDELVDLQNS